MSLHNMKSNERAAVPVVRSTRVWVLPATIAAVQLVDLSAGAAVAMGLGAIASIVSPVSAISILLLGEAFRLNSSILGVQTGWLIVFCCAIGSGVFVLFRRGPLEVNRVLAFVALTFAVCGLASYMLAGGRLDRLGALLCLVLVLAIITGPTASRVAVAYGLNSQRTLVQLIGITGALVFVVTLATFAGSESRLARGGELALRLGESSPRMQANIMGLAAVSCLVGSAMLVQSVAQRFGMVALGLFCLMGVVYSGSRMPTLSVILGAAAGLAFGWYATGARIRSKMMQRLPLVLAGVAGLIGVLIIGARARTLPFLPQEVASFRVIRDVSITSNVRWRLWEIYLENIGLAEFFIGTGIDGFDEMMVAAGRSGATHPHSVFVGAFAAFGIFGFAALLFMVLWGIRTAIRSRSAVAVGIWSYACITMTSSSSIDRPAFWLFVATAVLIVVATRFEAVQGQMLDRVT